MAKTMYRSNETALKFSEVPLTPDAIGSECRWWHRASLPPGAPGGLKLYATRADAVFALVAHRRLGEEYAAGLRSGLIHYPYDGGAWGFYVEPLRPLEGLCAPPDVLLQLGWVRATAEARLWPRFMRASSEGWRDPEYGVVYAQPPIHELASPSNWGVTKNGSRVVLMDCGPATLRGRVSRTDV